jgi:mevalonate kinase
MGVAIARALVPGSTPDGAADLAMAWERVFHGNPSGIDAVVAARGGSVLFRRGHPTQTVALGVPLTVCVGDTGVGSSTRTMVERVARLRDRDPSRFDEVMTSVASLVAGARRAVEAGDLARLGGLMNRNQSILRDMDLSTPAIDQLCAAALTAGAHGAKLTGGGGGGCVVALASDAGAAERVVAAWRGAGFEGFVARVTQQGDDT